MLFRVSFSALIFRLGVEGGVGVGSQFAGCGVRFGSRSRDIWGVKGLGGLRFRASESRGF